MGWEGRSVGPGGELNTRKKNGARRLEALNFFLRLKLFCFMCWRLQKELQLE